MDGFITIGTKLDTKQFDKQIADLERKTQELENELKVSGQVGYSSEDIRQVEIELEKTKNKLIRLRAEKQKLEQPQGLKELKTGIDNFGQGLQNAVKKASKLVLGIFGVRSAFLALRRASSELASYNEEYGANLEYIRFALTQMIAPVLENIVKMAMNLLAYINAIAQAWFGVNLFENASVDNFARMKKGVGGVTGAVKELKKQLAGFDEINVLQEDGSVGTGGGGGGITLPTMDLASIQDVQLPEWVRWIMEHKAEILGLLTAIAAFFAGVKIAAFINSLTGAQGAVLGFNTQLGKMVAGAALVAGGIAMMIGPIDNLVKNWDDLTEAERLAQIGLVILGGALEAFGLMMMGVSGPWAAVIALTTALTILLVKWEEEAIRIDNVKQAQDRLTEARERADKQLQQYTQAVDRADEAQRKLEEAEKNSEFTGAELNKMVTKNKDSYRDLSEEQKTLYKLFLENEDAQKNLNSVAEETQKAIEDQTDAFWLNELALKGGQKGLIEWRDEVVKATNDGAISAEDMKRVFNIALTDVKEDSYDAFKEGLETDIQDALDPRQYTNPLHWLEVNFKDTFQNIITWSEILGNALMWPIQLLGHLIKSGVSNWTGSFGQAKGAVVYNDTPHLAVGGIINQPGRGIPIGRAIAGERGAEGVIPLTDSQQMEILGEAIGRYITINASIPVSMNGRIISRELKQVQAGQEFAYNA